MRIALRIRNHPRHPPVCHRHHRDLGVQSPGINFINILWAVLCAQIPKAQKKTGKLSVFFCFWDLCLQKLLVECWWNWHPGLISPTRLCAAFTRADPNIKKYSQSVSLFAPLWSSRIKTASKMLVILTPDVNFTNILQAALAQIDPKSTKNIDDFFVFFFCFWNLCT